MLNINENNINENDVKNYKKIGILQAQLLVKS